MLPLLGALSTFVSLDLDVAQEYLPRLTQLEEENEPTSGSPLLPFYVSQRTMHCKTAATGVKSWTIVTLQATDIIYLFSKHSDMA